VIEQLLGTRPFQIGIVVRDVREAAARYTKLWGIEDWMIVENGPQNMHGLHYMGEPAEENVVASAGTHYTTSTEELAQLIRAFGKTPVQRDTYYEPVKTWD